MAKIKKDDIVKVISGKDKGKTGKVFMVFPKKRRVLVQGLNLVKKHMRRTREDEQAGIIQREAPLDISKVMLVCNRCSKPTRVGFTRLSDGTKVRICKKCKEII